MLLLGIGIGFGLGRLIANTDDGESSAAPMPHQITLLDDVVGDADC